MGTIADRGQAADRFIQHCALGCLAGRGKIRSPHRVERPGLNGILHRGFGHQFSRLPLHQILGQQLASATQHRLCQHARTLGAADQPGELPQYGSEVARPRPGICPRIASLNGAGLRILLKELLAHRLPHRGRHLLQLAISPRAHPAPGILEPLRVGDLPNRFKITAQRLTKAALEHVYAVHDDALLILFWIWLSCRTVTRHRVTHEVFTGKLGHRSFSAGNKKAGPLLRVRP
ncbi:hypothetical protein CF113_11810 [Aeromonas veronii]|nr:hypothetical protein CF113_11810 [Aeromonas veronii]